MSVVRLGLKRVYCNISGFVVHYYILLLKQIIKLKYLETIFKVGLMENL